MPIITDKLIARKDGALGWIIFNNPAKRNAMSMDMYEAMTEALQGALRHGGHVPGRAWVVLIGWAILGPVAAARLFRWE